MEGKTHHTVEDRKQRHEMYGDDVLNALLCGSKIHHVLKKNQDLQQFNEFLYTFLTFHFFTGNLFVNCVIK